MRTPNFYPLSLLFLIFGSSYQNAYQYCGGQSDCSGCDHAIKISCDTIYDEVSVCSGSLISWNDREWIFTANHCFENVTHVTNSCTFKTVQGQSIDTTTIDEGIVVDPSSSDGDSIRIFGLSPGTLISSGNLILLPGLNNRDITLDLSFDNLNGEELQFCSWGLVSEREYASEVKCMPFTLLTKGHCTEFDKNVDQNTFCAGVITGNGLTCKGDSGGSLIVKNHLNGKKYLLGIFSKGQLGNDCSFQSCDGNFEVGNEFLNLSSYLTEGHYHLFSTIVSDPSATPGGGMQGNYISLITEILMILIFVNMMVII